MLTIFSLSFESFARQWILFTKLEEVGWRGEDVGVRRLARVGKMAVKNNIDIRKFEFLVQVAVTAPNYFTQMYHSYKG